MEFKPGSNNRLSHSSSWSVLTWKTRERQNSKTKKVAISDNTCNVTLIRNWGGHGLQISLQMWSNFSQPKHVKVHILCYICHMLAVIPAQDFRIRD